MILAIATMDAIMLPLTHQAPASPSAPTGSRYIVGQDVDGRWLAVDAAHRGGGLFKSRAAAIHFAESETGHRPGGIILSPAPLRMEF